MSLSREQGSPESKPAPWRGWVPPFFGALVTTALLLAVAWTAFHSWREATYILTPYRGMPPVTPVYGFLLPQFNLFGVLLSGALLAAALYAWARLPAGRMVLFLCVTLLFAAAFRFSVHAAREGTLPGREFLVYPGEEVIFDVPRVRSMGGFLRDYTDLQPRLSLHGRTRPPGFALMHYAIQRFLGDHVLAIGSFLTLVASLIVVPAYGLGQAIRGREEDGRTCAMLVATAPGSVAFGAVSLDAIFAVVAAAAVLAAVRELQRPGWRNRMTLALSLFLAMMLSYSAFIVGLFCGLLLLLDRVRRPAVCAGHLLQVLGFFLLPFVGLYIYPGFDAWASWLNARRLNEVMMSAVVGQSTGGLPMWSYASPGNLLAFLIYLGLPIVAAWLLAPLRTWGRRELVFAAAFIVTLVIACGGGFYLMETERILLYLVAPAAAIATLNGRLRPFWAAGIAGLQAIALEVLIFTLW